MRTAVDRNFDADTQALYTFHVQQDTVLGPYVQTFMYPPRNTYGSNTGQSVFSHDGKTYASALWGDNDFIHLADFDRCTGVFANHRRVYVQHTEVPTQNGGVYVDSTPTGVCFSPNDSLLYVSTPFGILQWELYNPDSATAWVHVAGLDTTDPLGFQEYVNLYEGHDGKIYAGHFFNQSTSMSRIDNPNVKGIGCNFCPKCLDFPVSGTLGNGQGCCVSLPPNMPNYKLGPHPNCFTGVGQVEEEKEREFKLHPNPAHNTVTVQSSKAAILELTDMLGRIVLQQNLKTGKTNISTAQLPAGVYTYRCMHSGKQIAIGKLVVQH